MMEEGVELRDDLGVSPVGEMDDRAWNTLLSLVNGRITLETEQRVGGTPSRRHRVKQIGAEKLPAYTLDSLSKERLDEN